MEPKFDVGDRVCIVDRPYEDCVFGWIDEMDQLCGREVTIRDIDWVDFYGAYVYRIVGSRFSWCENCFAPTIDGKDFDVACTEEIKKLLGR